MEITIPSAVGFFKRNPEPPLWTHLCFRHAVIRSLVGERVETELVDYAHACEDCAKERQEAER